ncbi:MAG: winged helix-turn-helix domain-containing protein [Paludibacteraceae bacterium]|nr:winged helix-turn-helix domain-containing protein [Paludibacteraceae bacterium]
MNVEMIGANAGKIWNALQNGAQSSKALKKATKLKEAELNLALGWLAREGKLTFTELEDEIIIALV